MVDSYKSVERVDSVKLIERVAGLVTRTSNMDSKIENKALSFKKDLEDVRESVKEDRTLIQECLRDFRVEVRGMMDDVKHDVKEQIKAAQTTVSIIREDIKEQGRLTQHTFELCKSDCVTRITEVARDQTAHAKLLNQLALTVERVQTKQKTFNTVIALTTGILTLLAALGTILGAVTGLFTRGVH